jgi:predicted ABC-type transport system involved in lysophospholipase L1 biosynthesis ATPase subunit
VLDDVRRRHGTTILLVTNDEDVAGTADRVLRLRDGVIRGEERRRVPA